MNIDRRGFLKVAMTIAVMPLIMPASTLFAGPALVKRWPGIVVRWRGIQTLDLIGFDPGGEIARQRLATPDGVQICDQLVSLIEIIAETKQNIADSVIVVSRMPSLNAEFDNQALLHFRCAPSSVMRWVAAPGGEIIV